MNITSWELFNINVSLKLDYKTVIIFEIKNNYLEWFYWILQNHFLIIVISYRYTLHGHWERERGRIKLRFITFKSFPLDGFSKVNIIFMFFKEAHYWSENLVMCYFKVISTYLICWFDLVPLSVHLLSFGNTLSNRGLTRKSSKTVWL